jgi:pantoate--beta-alanine ligase
VIEVVRTAADMRRWREARAPGATVALVPTMGYLHAGHLSLVEEARRRAPAPAGRVVVSIFVNPTQFGPNEDFAVYPRDEAGDLAKAEAAGADLAFCPTDPATMYPSRLTWVTVDALGDGLCGRSRPGHFRGVCTVVTKLLALVRPHVSIFGTKDYQQLAIVRRMHADLFLPGEIVGMPIVREPDGLAMSSRNANLSPAARTQALAISRLLEEVRARFAAGEREVEALVAGAHERLAPGDVEYVEVVDADDLRPVGGEVTAPVLVAIAARFGGVRLIDNTVLRP